MSIIDKLKNLGRRLMGKEPTGEEVVAAAVGPYYPSTSRERKLEQRINVRYAHVSGPIIQPAPADIAAHEKLRQLGFILPPPQPGVGKGVTLYTGKGYIKREADRISAELGWSNKQRIKLRGRMQARASELRAAS